MPKLISAIGPKGFERSNKKIVDILSRALARPDINGIYPGRGGKKLSDSLHYIDDSFGLAVYGEQHRGSEDFQVKDWQPFAFSESEQHFTDTSIYKNGKNTYAFCSDSESDAEVSFRLVNVSECMSVKQSERNNGCMVNIAGLCEGGSIIFPIAKTEEALRLQVEEEKNKRELINLIRKGDETAVFQMFRKTMEMAEMIKERLKTDDVLSIFDMYFLPNEKRSGYYAILGEISDIEMLTNKYTNQKIYTFDVSIGNFKVKMLINKSDLLGMPMPGMRFMGTCELQGTVRFL